MAKAGQLLLAAGFVSAALFAAPVLFLSSPAANGSPAPKELIVADRGSDLGSSTRFAGSRSTSWSLSAVAIAAVAAFCGVRLRQSGSTALRASFDPYQPFMKEKKFAAGMIGGASAFSGQDYNFDPLCIGERSPRFLPWYREAELKHGRVCMLAWVGLVVPEFVRIPGPATCYTASVVDAHRACQRIEVEGGDANPLGQVLLFCGIVEALTTLPKVQEGITPQNAGDYRLGVTFLPKDDAKIEEMKLKELKNGRLAMIAFSGAITQAVLSGNGFPWLYAGAAHVPQTVGIAASLPAAKKGGIVGVTKVAMRAEPPTTGGYKMSAAVPFLPASPALEGLVGEEDGFDPMGFSLAVDIRWLREAELKHARVCMLATVGWITTDLGVRVPGEPFQVSTLEAHNAMIKFGSMPHMLVWIGMAEFFGLLAYVRMMEGDVDRAPGDFGIRVLYPKDEQGQYDMQLKELRNGRLAMLAFSGIVTSAALTQSTWPFFAAKENRLKDALAARLALCGVSHGRAFHRSVTGAAVRAEPSASLPFLPKPEGIDGWVGEEQEFDPLGFADTYDMKWLRESEIKHGRVCMLACVGFYAQQYIAFPGVDVCENANDALYKSPPGGLAALLFLAGYIESKSYDGRITMLDMFEGTDRAPGDFNFGSGFLAGKSEAEIKTMKLKELNNGRLAMFAFGGMVHHNYVVKGPLFPLFPDGWAGPQGTWNFQSVAGTLINGQVGNEVIPSPEYIATLEAWKIMPK